MRAWFVGAGFVVVGLLGTGVAVAWLSALLLDRRPPGPVRTGQRRQLRRFTAGWAALACAWLAGMGLFALR